MSSVSILAVGPVAPPFATKETFVKARCRQCPFWRESPLDVLPFGTRALSATQTTLQVERGNGGRGRGDGGGGGASEGGREGGKEEEQMRSAIFLLPSFSVRARVTSCGYSPP